MKNLYTTFTGALSILLLLFSPCLLASGKDIAPDSVGYQEKITVRGIVKDGRGDPLPGADLYGQVSGNHTVSGEDGAFSLEVVPGDLISVSYTGYIPQQIEPGKRTWFEVVLKEDIQMLDKVVVTALGIRQKEVALSYSVTQLDGEELTRVKDPGVIGAMAGKVAGVQINKTSSGLGASSKVLIRGSRSVVGNNQPLYVIDGVPILNSSPEQAVTAIGGTADAGNRDGGDGISGINPDDIESISVLKGPSASALYGSQAANGVILITTRKGNADRVRVSLSTGLLFDRAICLPRFQNSYGVSNGVESWGQKGQLPEYDNASDFFRTGANSTSSLSISAGNKRYQTYFSYANSFAKGIVMHNTLSKHSVTLRETASLLNDRLKLDGNVSVYTQKVKNKPPSGGFYMNPLVGLYRFPRGEDMTSYREHYQVWDPSRNLYVQNWHSDMQDFEQNPYWAANKIESDDKRNRAFVSLNAALQITSWLKIQARGSVDYAYNKVRQKFYASTAPALCGVNGRYVEADFEETLFYGDILALAEKNFNKFSVNVTVGASLNDKTVNSLRYDSKTASLKYANVFNIANINMNGSAYISQQIDARRQLQSLFGTVQLGYAGLFFIDATVRNDWSSTLAYTSHEKCGFFYPSFGASWIVNKTFSLPAWISLARIRGGWSRVGNDIPLFITNPVSHIGAGGEVEPADAAPFKEMEPEMTTSYEFGTEWRFLEDRIGINIVYYQTNTRNQFFKLPALSGDKYAYRYVNAGDIRNRGWEAALSLSPVNTGKTTWNMKFNFSANKNKVLKLHDELPVFIYGPRGFSSSYAMKLKEGGSFGDIYGKAFVRDDKGRIVYETAGDKKGLPLVEGDGNLIRVGNTNPAFSLSYANSVAYKNLTLSFLVDGRFGGEVLSQTEADMDLFGVTAVTARDRDRGYVELEGTRIANVQGFYKNIVGGRAGVTEYYMYDATNIRLRELALSYSLPERWMKAAKIVKEVTFSAVGRNLFFFYKKAPFDPELVLSTGNDNQGIEVYGMPTTRTLGFTIKVDF